VTETLIEIWSGVPAEARPIGDAVSAVVLHIAIASTLKNVHGRKRFAVAAVKAGDAVMHRLGLSEAVLVSPEHRAFSVTNRSPAWSSDFGEPRRKRDWSSK
jgi:molybdenum transport protein